MKSGKLDAVNLLFAAFSTLALFCGTGIPASPSLVAKVQERLDGVGLEAAIVFAALGFLFHRKGHVVRQGANGIAAVLAAVLSLFMLLGRSYNALGSWDFLFHDAAQSLFALVVLVGYFLLFHLLLSLLFDRVGAYDPSRGQGHVSWLPERARSHVFRTSFLVMLACWLPYLLVFLPGSVPEDGFCQLREALGLVPATEHHPYILSLFFGAIFSVGRGAGDGCGITLLVAVMAVAEAACYAWCCVRLRQWKLPEALWLAVLAFYALVPIFASYAQAVAKDGLYFAVFALYMAEYVEVCRRTLSGERAIGTGEVVLFSLCSLLVCLCRNNGIHVVLPANICLALVVARNCRPALVASILVVLCTFGGYKQVLLPALDVQPGSVREVLSIPFQQTARYLKYHPDDVTCEERQCIGRVLDVDHLAEKYNPELSDPVKDTFRQADYEADPAILVDYFGVWGRMFLRHPGVYVEAFLHNTYGYLCPFVVAKNGRADYFFYIKWKPGEPDAKGLEFRYLLGSDVRGSVWAWAEAWRFFPVSAQVLNAGTYTWLLLVIAGLMLAFCRKWSLVVLVAPLFNVLVCLASPVNGYLRYAWPVAACMPVVVWWLVLCIGAHRAGRD